MPVGVVPLPGPESMTVVSSPAPFSPVRDPVSVRCGELCGCDVKEVGVGVGVGVALAVGDGVDEGVDDIEIAVPTL